MAPTRFAIAVLLLALTRCSSGDGGTPPKKGADEPAKPAKAAVSITISPATATLFADESYQFSATVSGASDTSVVWLVGEENGGTVTAHGLYRAPALAGTYHVIASATADGTQKAYATVTVAFDPSVVKPASLTAGDRYTCALTAGGGLACWGANDYGQLGVGTYSDTVTPAIAEGLATGVLAVTSGGQNSHTCIIDSTGSVRCWGANFDGQLGLGPRWETYVPYPDKAVPLPAGAVAVATGNGHTCALLSTGAVMCWGDNTFGQLGDGTEISQTSPVSVPGLASGVTAISAGELHTCAIQAGAVKCWGNNYYGQLGDGTTNDHNRPTPVGATVSGAVALAAGDYHTCAVTAGGGVQCWGLNSDGQLGDGSIWDLHAPAPVSGLSSGVASLAAGRSHTCARLTSGGLTCFGDNDQGQLGDGTTIDRSSPVSVVGIGTVKDVSLGWDHTCARLTDDSLRCWGHNDTGELGLGFAESSYPPVAVRGLESGVTALGAGDYHACAALAAGGARCWGENDFGQLGDGTTSNAGTPVTAQSLNEQIAALAGGGARTCALTEAGGVKCWGNELLGTGSFNGSTVPVFASGLSTGAMAIAAGNHTCAVLAGGGLTCWGWNFYGEVGDGTSTERAYPTSATVYTATAQAVQVGASHTCALSTAGGVACWGDNTFGQLGDGTNVAKRVPVLVPGLASNVVALTANEYHSCALTGLGSVWCWGSNWGGESSGYGVFHWGDWVTGPTEVPDLTGVIKIVAGAHHTCALTSGGAVRCWGAIAGVPNDLTRGLPHDVTGLSSGVADLVAGDGFSCALTTGGAVRCWGGNTYGDLGDDTAFRTTPARVLGLP